MFLSTNNRPFQMVPVLGVFALLASSAAGQVSSFENKRITDVQYSAALALDPADLAKAVPFHKGDTYSAENIATAIDNLFATGRFADIVAEAEPSGDGVIVRFVTKPVWFIGGVTAEGDISSPPSRSQIAAITGFQLGAPFHEEDLTQAVSTIRDVLKANGLYEAEVTSQVVRDPDSQQIFVTINVQDHKRAKYEMPVIRAANLRNSGPDQNSADRTGAPIAAVAVATPQDTKLPDGTIVHATGWRIPIIHWWRKVTDSRTRKGVQGVISKYESQDRLTATAHLDQLDYDASRRRVRPHLTVDPGPKVKVKAVEAKVSHRMMKRYVPVFQENTVNNDLLTEGKRNLTSYFENKGYYDVDVDVQTAPPVNDLQTIEYVISQGPRYKLVHLAFVGNHYFKDQTLRERMFLQPASFSMRHGRYSEAFRHRDEQNIAVLYRSNGFRDVKVTSSVDRKYRGKEGQVAVTMQVDEGAQWLVDHVALTGAVELQPADLLPRLTSVAGQPFAEVNLAADRNELLTYYYSHGFPEADVKVSWTPADGSHHVDVTFALKEGGRRYVRRVITSGLRTTRQRLVDRNITLKPGDPLSPVEETDIQKQFYDLGLFASVDTAIENPDGNTDYKYVIYHFQEANRYILGIGVGAQVGSFGTPSTTSLASPAGSTGFSPEFSLDVSRLNLFGVGQSATFHSLFSTLEQRGSINYLIPHLKDVRGRDLTFTVLYDKALNVRTFSSRREELSVQLSNRFSKSVTAQFMYSYRRVSVGDVVIPVLLIPQLLQAVRLGMFSGTFIQDRRDNKGDPHRGILNTADIGLATHYFGGQRSFAKVLLRNATYYPLPHNMVLARQTQFGIIAPFNAPAGLSTQESVPLPERFFAGGADSLRAFPYNQAGPRDTGAPVTPGGPTSEPTGFPLGGNALFINNVELRFPFIGQDIQGVFFHDMGNVFSSVNDISFRVHQNSLDDFNYMVHAVGYGIRYRTPVGPIRLDLAYSINPPQFVGFNGTPQELLACNPNLPPQGACVGVKQGISHVQFFFSIGQTF
jgi:outer membrane protein insertion porin family